MRYFTLILFIYLSLTWKMLVPRLGTEPELWQWKYQVWIAGLSREFPIFLLQGDFPTSKGCPCRCKKRWCEDGHGDETDISTSQCHQGLLPQPQGRAEPKEWFFLRAFYGRTTLPTSWFLTFSPRIVREYISVVLTHELAVICYNSPRKVLQILVIQFGLATFQVCNSHMWLIWT